MPAEKLTKPRQPCTDAAGVALDAMTGQRLSLLRAGRQLLVHINQHWCKSTSVEGFVET